jgi:hypothetical protein
MNKARVWVFILLVAVVSAALLAKFGGLVVSSDFPMANYLNVFRVPILDNTPYLFAYQEALGDHRYFSSSDYGKTWQEIPSLPPEIRNITNIRGWGVSELARVNLSIACVPQQPGICYGITGKAQVEISQDDGQTWQIDWRMPTERMEFMRRNPANIARFPPKPPKPDMIPLDLGIIENNNQYAVIAAMGNQGVLVKTSGGKWERYGVYASHASNDGVSAVPLPFYATSFETLTSAVGQEVGWILFATAIFFVLFGERHKSATGYFLLFTLLPFLLWAFGLIATYEVALVISIALGLVVLAGSVLLAKQTN